MVKARKKAAKKVKKNASGEPKKMKRLSKDELKKLRGGRAGFCEIKHQK